MVNTFCIRVEKKNNSGTCPGNLYSYFGFRENRCREVSAVLVGVNKVALTLESWKRIKFLKQGMLCWCLCVTGYTICVSQGTPFVCHRVYHLCVTGYTICVSQGTPFVCHRVYHLCVTGNAICVSQDTPFVCHMVRHLCVIGYTIFVSQGTPFAIFSLLVSPSKFRGSTLKHTLTNSFRILKLNTHHSSSHFPLCCRNLRRLSRRPCRDSVVLGHGWLANVVLCS